MNKPYRFKDEFFGTLFVVCLFGFILLILNAAKDKPCEEMKHKFSYAERVLVTNGFYKGVSGFVSEPSFTYRKEGLCQIPAYIVTIGMNGKDVKINENDLTKEPTNE